MLFKSEVGLVNFNQLQSPTVTNSGDREIAEVAHERKQYILSPLL